MPQEKEDDNMLPKVIMHNTVSVDGSVRDFEFDIGLHYQIAARFKADVTLVGSTTAKIGIEMFMAEVPQEQKSDFVKPIVNSNDKRPLWIIVDSCGILENLLHVYRRSEYCKGVIVLVSKRTPKSYIDYLKERNYDFILTGKDHVDYRKALKILNERYNVKTVLTDTGGTLGSILLENGLVDEISLLISPVLVGKAATNLFRSLNSSEKLELITNEAFDRDHVHLVYNVLK